MKKAVVTCAGVRLPATAMVLISIMLRDSVAQMPRVVVEAGMCGVLQCIIMYYIVMIL